MDPQHFRRFSFGGFSYGFLTCGLRVTWLVGRTGAGHLPKRNFHVPELLLFSFTLLVSSLLRFCFPYVASPLFEHLRATICRKGKWIIEGVGILYCTRCINQSFDSGDEMIRLLYRIDCDLLLNRRVRTDKHDKRNAHGYPKKRKARLQ